MTMITQEQYDAWTGIERQALLFRLLDAVVGPIEAAGGMALIPFASTERILPGHADTVVTICHARCHPERLVILEPLVEHVETETKETYKYVRDGFFRRRLVKVVDTSIKVDHRVSRKVSRDTWSVTGAFSGAENQFPTRGALDGSLFAPTGDTMHWASPLVAGQAVTLQIRNNGLDPVPFRAVLVGKIVR